MKTLNHSLLYQIILLLVISIPVQSRAMDLQIQPGVTYDWWQDNHNAHASQLSFPLQITGTQDDLSFRLITAYTRTALSTGSKDISLSGMVDTKIGTTYRLSNKVPFELLLGIDFNLPTGHTKLSSDETLLIMDPDLLPLNTYGEGFNVNPTVTIAKGWNNWIFSLGLGYLWRGKYDFNEFLTGYQPGMAYNAHLEVRHYFRNDSYAKVFADYAIFSTDTSEGRNIFREGDVLQIGGLYIHSLRPGLKISAGLKGIFRGDATVYDKTSGTQQNLNAFNGTETVCDLGLSYALDKKTVLSIPIQGRLMDSNGNSAQYHVGSKKKISLGVGTTREITPMLSADIMLKGFYKHDDATMIPEETGAREYAGFGISASLTGKF